MTHLLSRYAESLFWFGRYTERATCLARLLEAQTSFDRGHAGATSKWSWMLTLYDDEERFLKSYDTANTESVIRFYVSDRENPGSVVSCIGAARENARTLRALLPTELWHQVNTFYNRFRNLSVEALSGNRLANSCQLVKKECYAQLGVADETIYRDEAWHFFMLGVLLERADQMSRLLDVRFAQNRVEKNTGGDDEFALDELGDFAFWSVLLRSVAAQQAFLRMSAGKRDPESIARFLILDANLPRSVKFCVSELKRVLGDLRSDYGLNGADGALREIRQLDALLAGLDGEELLVDSLHEFNDSVQVGLIGLTNELAYSFFGAERPTDADLADAEASSGDGAEMSQSQSQSQR